MNTNRIPESYGPLLKLARSACGGTSTLAASLGLQHNQAAAVHADTNTLEDAQATYFEARAVHTSVRLQARAAADAGRAFCASAIDMLKSYLGRRWNARWQAVGFTGGSLALKYDPLPTLMDLAAYLSAHPSHENAPLEITAARAEQMKSALIAARIAADAAHTTETQAKQARDLAFARLRHRLSGLRTELTLVLDRTSAQWHQFGFRRPADGRAPSEVRDVTVRPCGERAVVVNWKPSALAENFRVSWRIAGSADAPNEVGLFADRQALIEDLPLDVTLVIAVSARNQSGETKATEREITWEEERGRAVSP